MEFLQTLEDREVELVVAIWRLQAALAQRQRVPFDVYRAEVIQRLRALENAVAQLGGHLVLGPREE